MAFYSSSKFTLSDLKQDQSYHGRLTVKVIKLQTVNLKPGQCSIKLALADETTCMRGRVSGIANENKFQTDNTYIIKNFTVKDKTVIISDKSSVLNTAPMTVSPEVEALAAESMDKPVHQFQQIAAAKMCGLKAKVSVKGILIADASPKTVMFKGEPLRVREIRIQDSTDEMFASLWRQSADVEIAIGSTVELRDVTTNYSSYHREITLCVNHPANIQISSTSTPLSVDLLAISKIENSSDVEVLCEADGIDRETKMSWKQLLGALKVTSDCDFEELLPLLPVHFTGTITKDGYLEKS